jgi:hypothetical protein
MALQYQQASRPGDRNTTARTRRKDQAAPWHNQRLHESELPSQRTQRERKQDFERGLKQLDGRDGDWSRRWSQEPQSVPGETWQSALELSAYDTTRNDEIMLPPNIEIPGQDLGLNPYGTRIQDLLDVSDLNYDFTPDLDYVNTFQLQQWESEHERTTEGVARMKEDLARLALQTDDINQQMCTYGYIDEDKLRTQYQKFTGISPTISKDKQELSYTDTRREVTQVPWAGNSVNRTQRTMKTNRGPWHSRQLEELEQSGQLVEALGQRPKVDFEDMERQRQLMADEAYAREMDRHTRQQEDAFAERLRQAMLRKCFVCTLDEDSTDMVQFSCGHWYCKEGLRGNIKSLWL